MRSSLQVSLLVALLCLSACCEPVVVPPPDAQTTAKLAQARLELEKTVQTANAQIADMLKRATEERAKAEKATEEAIKKAEAAKQQQTEAEKGAELARKAATKALTESEKAKAAAEKARLELEAARRDLKATVEASVPRKIALGNVEPSTTTQREFLYRVTAGLRKHGMVVKCLDEGQATNWFMAFSTNGGKLTIGGTKVGSQDGLLQHKDQWAVLLSTLTTLRTNDIKVTEFKFVPAPAFGLVLSDKQHLTILWPSPDYVVALRPLQ